MYVAQRAEQINATQPMTAGSKSRSRGRKASKPTSFYSQGTIPNLLSKFDRANLKTTSELSALNYGLLVQSARIILVNQQLRWWLDPEELVHIAYLRLAPLLDQVCVNNEVFVAYFVAAMKNAAVDTVRFRDTKKEGGHVQFVQLD
jgi:hypothetical protein